MSEIEDLKEEINSLKKQMNELETIIKNLMNMHRNVLERLSTNSEVEKRYINLLSLYERFGRISPSLIPEIDDPVSERIVEVLLDKKSANVTQITGAVRRKRGSASRHTVRDRLGKLEEEEVVEKVEQGRGKNYRLTEGVIEKWAELLGIKK